MLISRIRYGLLLLLFIVSFKVVANMPGGINYKPLFNAGHHVGGNNSLNKGKPVVNATAFLNAGSVSGVITKCVGSALPSSNTQQFQFDGIGLTAQTFVTAPAGFEISLNAASGFSGQLSLSQSGGSIATTVVYVRASASNTSITAGNVAITSAGAAALSIAVKATFNQISTTNTVANQTVTAGSTTPQINLTGTAQSYMWTNSNPAIGLAASGVGSIASFTALNAGNAPIVATITATPVADGLIYFPIYGGGLNIINTQTLKVIGRPQTVNYGPINLGFSADFKYVYVTYAIGDVSVFSTATNQHIAEITCGTNPLGISATPDGTKLYITNNVSNDVTVVNALTNTPITSIAVGLRPASIITSADSKTVYVNNQQSGNVSVIDVKSNKVTATITVGGTPDGLCLSPDGSRLYVANSTNVSVINTANNTVLSTITVNNPTKLCTSLDGKTLYVTNFANNTVSFIDLATNTVTQTLPVDKGPGGISLTADGTELFVASSLSSTLTVINTATQTVIATPNITYGAACLGNFIMPGTGCAGPPVTFNITVNPTPIVTAGTVSGNITACAGSASASPNIEQFTVTGTNLSADIIATAPPGFEVSLSASSGYNNTVTLPQKVGVVASTVVYVRSAATATGNITGNVVLTTAGAAAQNIAVKATVNPLATVNAVANQTVTTGITTAPVNFTGTALSYTWTNSNPAIGLPASGTGNIAGFTAVNTGNTPLVGTITATPATGGFAYIPNNYDYTVSVVNTVTNQVTATIQTGASGPNDVAFSPDQKTLYVSNSASSNVTVINTATNTVTGYIAVGTGTQPYCMAVSADGSRLYLANFGSGTVSVINTVNNTIISNIIVGTQPIGVLLSLDGSKLYVTNYASKTISIISTATNTVTSSISSGFGPYALCMSIDGSKIYVVNQGDNTVSVYNTANNALAATITVGKGPRGINISPDGSRVYCTNNDDNTVSVINTANNTNINTVSVGKWPQGVSLTADGSKIYITNSGDNTVTVLNPTSYAVLATVNVGVHPAPFGNFITSGTTCAGPPVTFNITVNPTPTVTAGTVSGNITACAGSASASPNLEQFTVTGTGLSADIVATAPTGFEVSLSAGIGYGNAVTLAQTAGVVASTVVYVRSAATATGNITGNVVLTTAGTTAQNIPVKGVVNALATVNAVANQTVTTGTTTAPVNFTGTALNYTWTNSNPAIGLPASGTGNIAGFTGTNTGNTALVGTVTATPVAGGFAYVANYFNTVSVINVTTNVVVATIKVGQQPQCVAVSPDGSRVFVTNRNDNNITVIDTRSNTVIATIPANFYPLGITVSPDGSRLYVVNHNQGNITVINTASNTIVGNIAETSDVWDVRVTPDGSKLYATDYSSNTVTAIDLRTSATITKIYTGAFPLELAFTPDGSRLYVTNSQSNTVSVINPSTNSVIATVIVGLNPKGIAVTPDGKSVYVSNYADNTVSVINTATNTVRATFAVGSAPYGVSVSPDGARVLVVNSGSGTASLIDPSTNTLITTVTVGTNPASPGNLFSGGVSCPGQPATFTITVDPPPVIVATGTPAAVNTTFGTASPSTSFTVSGSWITAGILITPPPGFEVSTDNITFGSTVTVGAAGGANATKVYIRLVAANAAGSYGGNVVLSSPGATSVNVAIPNSVVGPAPLTVIATSVSKTYGATLTGGSGSTAFTVNTGGLQNVNTITSVTLSYGTGGAATDAAGLYTGKVTASAVVGANGFLLSNYTLTYANADILVTPAALTLTADSVVKPYGLTLGTQTGATGFTAAGLQNGETVGSVTLTYGSGAAVTDPIAKYPGSVTPAQATGGTFNPANYTITYVSGTLVVVPAKYVTVTGMLAALTTVYGTPSAAGSFTVGGTGLVAGITVNPPPGFEVSLDNSRYTATLLAGGAGSVAATQIYIRLGARTSVGTYSGVVLVTSPNVSDKQLTMPVCTVTPAPLTIKADDKVKSYAMVNPPLTLTYNGFVNGEGPAQLLTPALASTMATTNSPVGQYPITVSGATAANYIITSLSGVLTITDQQIVTIPNTFTPNGDGVNDYWSIKNITGYPQSMVSVYNRSGQMVYQSQGYAVPWDGTFNGQPVPAGTYYYIILLRRDGNRLSGPITVVR
jgi:gliding motility-associated-like protein